MEVDIENIQFSEHCVKLTGSLVKRIFTSLRKKCVHVTVYFCCLCCIFGSIVAVIGLHATPRSVAFRIKYHKTLTDSETPSKDESAVLASPTSSTCSLVPAICITPDMIAINIFIKQKVQVKRKKINCNVH